MVLRCQLANLLLELLELLLRRLLAWSGRCVKEGRRSSYDKEYSRSGSPLTGIMPEVWFLVIKRHIGVLRDILRQLKRAQECGD